LTDIIQQDLHVIEITGELPEQHNDRFIEEIQEPDLTQYNLNSSQNSTKEYFAKELIRIIIKNWKYDYPREQFEETQGNITDLMTKNHNRFELADLKSRIRLTKNECLQHYLSTIKRQPLEDKLFQINPTTSRIFEKNIQWKDVTIEKEISLPEQAEKYKESREKMNNIFDKPSKEEMLKTFNQDPYTSKIISTFVQPRYKLNLTELPLNKADELTNISPFNKPLFNHLILIEHLKESLYIRIAANKKNQLTEGQYQDWQQQMLQKIEKQYNSLYNEEKQFSLKNIMKN
ncbi:4558_t:CDS:2, partial [Gigaspora margarita]